MRPHILLLQIFNGTAETILMIGTRYDTDTPRMTSPGNVVLLPYIKEMRNLAVLRLRPDEKHTQEWDFLQDGTAIAFSPKHLRMCFSDQFVIEL